MQLIPVLDVMNGQVVRAVKGDRASYQPVRSVLCAGSDPVTVARALLRHCGSGVLYLADLDALTGRPPQRAMLQHLLAALPELSLWLDAGFSYGDEARSLLAELGEVAERVTPVFGSESMRDRAALMTLASAATSIGHNDGLGPILSLDHRQGRPLDPAGCWATPSAWPRRVIAMTLDRVGADAGPDLNMLAELRALAPQAQLIGAGGIRHAADLEAAAAAGAHAWLVASALHQGHLPAVVQADPSR